MKRVLSIDVYRGLVMLLMLAEVLNVPAVATALPGNDIWQWLAFQQSHVPWWGMSLHDMIQPSFSFLVGVAVPYSIASRIEKGSSTSTILRHAVKRSIILVLLGIFLRSGNSEQTYFTFEDTLTQIGLGYTFLVLLAFANHRLQLVAFAILLVGYWALFAAYPAPGPSFDYNAVGVSPDWQYHLDGFAAHWNKNSNAAWAFDTWFLNLFPREQPFAYNAGGYATLSFIPTLTTMLMGLFAGKVLRTAPSPQGICRFLLKWAGVAIITGLLLHLGNINPIVKRIWTPSWVLVSGGLCFATLAAFYWLLDVKRIEKWAFPLTVIGTNSIAAYFIADGGIRFFIERSLYIHLGTNYDRLFGDAYHTLVSGILILALEWLILYWMYRKKIFIKI